MRYLKKILAKVITGTELPQEAENNAKLVQQVRATPGLIHDHVIKSQCSQGRSEVHYVSSDNRVMARPTVLFVHGSPGSWESFAPYFLQPSLSEAFRLISIDRPGWGLSTFPGKAFPSELAEQARVLGPSIEAIYQQNKQQKIILVGHSLGGSLVPVLAATYPDYVRSVVILAGDVNPVLAQHRWYNSLLACVPRILVAKHWYHSNLEILDLAKSLANQQEMMAQVQQPISIMQGTNDRLTDPKNVHFAGSLFQQSALTIQWVPDKGHMINLMCVDLVKAAIVRSHESSESDSVP
ncbi:alpha/beta hydrolase [Marinomonas sp. TI.3.20]|uniref:alpha/beta fold hydrolase n=1 Tax=Marinomonas sp. TI.3.20 TaxID=3121296 RepID=UPI00311D6B6D